MRIPLWIKVLWTVCVIAWIPLYWRQYGPQNFLFFCDLGNLFITAGLWMESALIFSWQANGLLLFQTLFIIDLAGTFLSGRHWIGGIDGEAMRAARASRASKSDTDCTLSALRV